MNRELSLITWNINGNVINKLPILENLIRNHNIVCLQEHFLINEGTELLNIGDSIDLFAVGAKSSGSGRPSGGIAILASKSLRATVFQVSDNFIAIKVERTIIFSVYMPTDYKSSRSYSKFVSACRKLANAIANCRTQDLSYIVAGDMNCDLLNPESPRSQVLSTTCAGLNIIENYLDFTYVHNSGATSSLDFIMCSHQPVPLCQSHVDTSISASDHLPVSYVFPPSTSSNYNPDLPSGRKWHQKVMWDKINTPLYQKVCDDILARIRVPYNLLHKSSSVAASDKQVLINIYCSEIVHALQCAEKAAVPICRVRIGSEIPHWSDNSDLVNACADAKFWLRMWIDNDRPRHGIVNSIRLYTKRRFAKTLAIHRAMIIECDSKYIKQEPDRMWKFLKKKKRKESVDVLPSESEWVKYFTHEFSSPNADLENKFSIELDASLAECEREVGFVVSNSSVSEALSKLKKKLSRGVDNLCGLHLQAGSQNLVEHLCLLYQMIFNAGVVPDLFCTGVITPVLKKGKDGGQCSSYRPITVAPILCKLFELLVVNRLSAICNTPDNQFGFKKKMSREHAHYLIANLLIDADDSNETLYFAGHDVNRAFDSGVHPQILLSARKRGVDKSIIRALRNMYSNLKARVNVPCVNALTLSSSLIPVEKGIRQGALTSPPLFNNSIISSQEPVQSTCIFRGLNVSLIDYADDILNASRTLIGIEETFRVLSKEYGNIGLSFNPQKSEVLVFNSRVKDSVPVDVIFGIYTIKSSSKIMYLGLPICSDLKETRDCLVSLFAVKTRRAYGILVSMKCHFNRFLLARVYNAFVLPHVLALSPFWKIFTSSDRRNIRSIFYRYGKYLLRLPVWMRNSNISLKYGIADPLIAVLNRRVRFAKAFEPSLSSLYVAIT